MTSCGEAVVGLLEDLGTGTVFGIPGVHTLELYRGLARSPLRHVAPRHEQGAGFMADGWARVSGRPGVCVLISGPGLTNAITPIAQAYHDSIPMLVISAVVPESQRGLGEIHDLPDQQGLMAKVTAFSRTIASPEDLPEAFAQARAVWESGRPRPVHVQVPVDVLAQTVGPLPAPAAPPPAPAPDDEVLRRAAQLLREAQTPLIILGGGARDAGEAALALARRLGAPVGLTINARGAIDHDDPLCLGSALSFPPVDDLLRGADATLLVGAQLSELELWGLTSPLELQGLVRVDIDASQLQRGHHAAVGLHGEAQATLRSLAATLGPPDEDARLRHAEATARVAAARAGLRPPEEVSRFAEIVAALDQALPPDRIVAADSTQPAYAANHTLPMHTPRSWLMPIGYGCLGCALPMAIGAKLAAPDRPVAALAGDGGFMFTLQELATAREAELALPVVVYDNDGYGEIREAMDHAHVPHLGTDGTVADLLTIARGFGCGAERASDPEQLRSLVERALYEPRPTVIQIR